MPVRLRSKADYFSPPIKQACILEAAEAGRRRLSTARHRWSPDFARVSSRPSKREDSPFSCKRFIPILPRGKLGCFSQGPGCWWMQCHVNIYSRPTSLGKTPTYVWFFFLPRLYLGYRSPSARAGCGAWRYVKLHIQQPLLLRCLMTQKKHCI